MSVSAHFKASLDLNNVLTPWSFYFGESTSKQKKPLAFHELCSLIVCTWTDFYKWQSPWHHNTSGYQKFLKPVQLRQHGAFETQTASRELEWPKATHRKVFVSGLLRLFSHTNQADEMPAKLSNVSLLTGSCSLSWVPRYSYNLSCGRLIVSYKPPSFLQSYVSA